MVAEPFKSALPTPAEARLAGAKGSAGGSQNGGSQKGGQGGCQSGGSQKGGSGAGQGAARINENYLAYVRSLAPPTKHFHNCYRAFIVGGLICCIGQFFRYVFEAAFGLFGAELFCADVAGELVIGFHFAEVV